MPKPESQVLIRRISQSGAALQVLFWAFDINKSVQLKGDMLEQIYVVCSKEGLNII